MAKPGDKVSPQDAQEPAIDPATSRASDVTMARVDRVAEMMARGSWHIGLSEIELAKEWGVTVSRVRHIASEARRALARCWDPEQVRETLLATIAAIGRDALDRREEVVDKDGCVHEVRKPDHRSAIRAAEVVADLMGLRVQRHEVKHELQGLSEEQLLEQAKRWLEKQEPPQLVEADGEEQRH